MINSIQVDSYMVSSFELRSAKRLEIEYTDKIYTNRQLHLTA